MDKLFENQTNEKLLEMTFKDIHKLTKKILHEEMKLKKNDFNKCIKLLENYIYIDEIHSLRYGSIIRWFSLNTQNKIPYVGILCEKKVTDNGLIIVCKNFMNKYFTIDMKHNIIFQKLNNDEKMIISAMEIINNKNH